MNDEQATSTGLDQSREDTSSPKSAYLEVLFGPMAGKQYVLAKDTVVVGRGDNADFVLDDPTMSRRHLAIRRLPDGFHLTDLGGSNGTLINGKPVSELVLEDGMTVETGTTVFTFRLGVLQKTAKEDVSLRLRDTQELPAIGKARDNAAAPGRKTATQPGMHQQGARRHGLPSPSLSQLVSWVVVLALLAGGILLALSLLDHSAPPRVAPKDLEAEQAGRQTRGLRPPVPVGDDGALAIAAAPDVAQERLRAATELESGGDLAGALEIYQEINARYPEFLPSSGPAVAERVDTLKKKISYGELMARAQVLFDDAGASPKALLEMCDELGVIPTSDKEFGEKAHELTLALKLRIKESEEDAARDRLLKVEGGDPASPDTGIAPSPPPAPPAETPSSSADDARSKAKALYKNGKFDDAVSLLREAASGPDGDSIGRLAGRIDAFGKIYKEALATARDAGLEEDAVDLMEKARALDGDLYGSYRNELDELLASTSVALSQRHLSDGDFPAARRMLDTARKYRSSNKEVSKLDSLFAFKASQLVKQARDAAEPATAIELLDQAILLAGPDSSAGNEAAQLKKKLAEK